MMKRAVALLGAIMLIFASLLFLSSCDAGVTEESDLYKNVDKMVAALSENNVDAARAIMAEVISDEKFYASYPKLRERLDGIGEYTLEIVEWRSGKAENISYKNVSILLVSDKGEFLIFAEERSDMSGLSVFNMQNYKLTGTPATLGESSGLQIALLFVNVIEIVFVIYAFIDCARSDIEKKPLLLVFMLLGRMLLCVDLSAGSLFSLEWLIGYTSYIKTTQDYGLLTVAVPLVAIIWFVVKRQLIDEKRKKDEALQVKTHQISEDEE